MSIRHSVIEGPVPGRTYLPAAGRDWALPLYDPLVKLLGGDRTRTGLLRQAAIRPGQSVLDIGCGTGTLAALLKGRHPDVEVIGLDPDPKALARARRKAAHASAAVRFDQGFSDDLPYPDAYFDRVLSSFMFHHLPADEKTRTLREALRVLKPDGWFHMVDFEGPEETAGGSVRRALHSSHRLIDNSERRVLALMRQAGFAQVKKVGEGSMLFGLIRVAYYGASAG